MQFGPPKLVTNNLILCLDAANLSSYPGSGTTWTDLSGNNNTGTLINGPTFNGSNGGSIVFNGTNNHVDITDFSLGNQFTYSFWIKTSTTNLGQIIARGNSADNRGVGFYINNIGAEGKLGASGNNGSGWNAATISNTIINDNQWHHVVGVYNQTTNNCVGYVDGVLGLSATITMDSNSYTPKNTKIGRNQYTTVQYYTGNIALGQIYNTGLTATEILQNYNSTKSRFGL